MRPDDDSLWIWTGAACNCRCTICPVDGAAAPAGATAGALERRLAALREEHGARLAVMVGGEPFVRRDLFRLVAAVQRAGLAPGLVSNARMLCYPEARTRLRAAGLAYLRAQLFGGEQDHDRVTGVPGSFRQALEGLAAWTEERETASAVDVAVTLSPGIIPALPRILEHLAQTLTGPDVHLVVRAGLPAKELKRSAVLGRALAELAGWNDDPARPVLRWEGLPARLAPLPAHLATDPPRPYWVGTGAAPPATCLGPRAHEPIEDRAARPRANSFNYVRRSAVRRALAASPRECRGDRTPGDLGPERLLWLADGDRMTLFATDADDFAPSAIAAVKDTYGHLFFDCSPTAALDDFGSLRRVAPDPFCDPCARRVRCGRRFRALTGQPFAREEAWIAACVSALRGRVLDVGCGEQLYRQVLAPLIRSGAIEYHGLDPDAAAVARLRRALPEGRYHVGPIETFAGAPESYDHVLCLRALNHVADLRRALARMAALVRVSGTLLLVECTPFALLREARQVAHADRQPQAGHQHLRNLDSREILPLARLHALEVLYHQPVSREATNEWILHLRRG